MTTPRNTLLSALLLLACTGTALAGSLEPPTAPTDPASALYTTNDLYNRLTTGAAGAKRSGPFVEPAAPPGPTGHTTDELMAVMPTADNANGATVADVLSGKTFWGLRTDGTWGVQTGTIPAQTLNPASASVAAGYYAATNLTAVDPDLVTANIKAGVGIFGVPGKPEVVDTTEAANPATVAQILAGKKAFVNGVAVVGTVPEGSNVFGGDGLKTFVIPDGMYNASVTATANDANLATFNIKAGVTIFGVTGSYGGGSPSVPIPVGKTGQTLCYDSAGLLLDCVGTGQDGAWQKGVASPTPRFTDNLNGTATDNATGLIWIKNANCFGVVDWSTAITSANNLTSGACGLNDGSSAGQWRVPNIKELQSLIDFSQLTLSLPPGHPFTNFPVAPKYWSSTTIAGNFNYAWITDLLGGSVVYGFKSSGGYLHVWPVRGGQ